MHSFLDATQHGLPLSQNSNVWFLRPEVRNANKSLNQHRSPPPSSSLGRTPRGKPHWCFYPLPGVSAITGYILRSMHYGHLHMVRCLRRHTQHHGEQWPLPSKKLQRPMNIKLQQYMCFPMGVWNWCFLVISEELFRWFSQWCTCACLCSHMLLCAVDGEDRWFVLWARVC